ncbi:trace amine-associated receptor 1-like [Lytechinus variegatus]|uniref:trace amine-associated receptor 1-like n=1 Tax=Lytechinus variegatus TaxID=7654 RepID=UPI001BB24C46|nr:trace amine-associated receptor 1-like [Lytechinus variegatus]
MAIIRSVFYAFYAIIFAIGLPSNMVILAVYAAKRKKNGTDVFIMGLSITDLLSSMISLLKFKVWVASDIFCKIKWFIDGWFIGHQWMMTVIISIDRYLAVCFPVHRRPKVRQAIIIVAIAYLFTFTVMTPCLPAIHYLELIKDCMYRSDLEWFNKFDNYFTQGFTISIICTSSLFYYRTIFALRRLSKVHARLVGNPSSTLALPSASKNSSHLNQTHINNSVETTSCKRIPGQDSDVNVWLGKPNHQTDQPTVYPVPGSSLSLNVPPKEASLLATTNESSTSQGSQCNLETVSGKHIDVPGPTTSTASVVLNAPSSQMAIDRGDQNDKKDSRLSEKKLTATLGVITSIQLISMIPIVIGRYIPIETRQAFMSRSNAHHTIYAIMFRLCEVNSFINVFVYWRLNKVFRRDCQVLFGRIWQLVFKKK